MLSKHDKNFKNTKFGDFSGLAITEILMNIMARHGLEKSTIPAVILTFPNALVTYYISKGFFIVETEVCKVDNIPTTVKNIYTLLIYIKITVLYHAKWIFPQLSTYEKKSSLQEIHMKNLYLTFNDLYVYL